MKIICPNFKREFKIEDNVYIEIVSQVKNELFEKELSEKIDSIKERHEEKEKRLTSQKKMLCSNRKMS